MPNAPLQMSKLWFFVRTRTEKFRSDILALVLYLILTLILLYPFSALNISTQLIGFDGGDLYQGLWNLWWVKHSLLSLSNPYTTIYIFYPLGTDLFAHSLSPIAGIFTIPFQLTVGLVSSYNLLIILSFVLGGYGAYQLAHYITADKKASFFAGIIFGFSAYHLARAGGHLNLASIQWIPLYVLFLLRMRNESSLKNVLLAAVFLVLSTFWADLQYLVFLGLFTSLLLIHDALLERKRIRQYLPRLGLTIIIFLSVAAWVIGPLFYNLLTGKGTYGWPISDESARAREAITWSADLLGFFTPSTSNLFFGNSAQWVTSHFANNGIENIVQIGFVALALTIFAGVKLWKEAKSWLLGASFFLLLSLGPTLQVFGSSNFTSFHLAIPLPELLWFYISPLPRAPSRFVLMATLCLGILSAISLKHINSWFDKLKRGKIIGIFFIIFLSVAFWAEVNVLPYHVTENTSVPTFYSDLSRMNGAFSVLDLPHDYSADNRYMYYGTVSEKPLVGGSISRIAPENVQFLQVFPVISQTDFVKNGGDPANWADIILQDVNTSNLVSFNLFNVKYLVLHRYLLSKMAFEKMNAYLNGLLGQPVFSDERIVAFGTTTHQLNKMSAFCSKGWWDVEEWAGQPTRWSDGNGTIKVMSLASAYYNVSFFTKTAIESKNLTVFLNGEEVGKFQIPIDTFSSIMIDGLLFNRGLNELTFYSEQSFIPLEVLPNSTDIRRMSIAFQNVSILPQDSTHR